MANHSMNTTHSKVSIGSAEDNDLVVAGPGVRAQHAHMALDENGHAWLTLSDTQGVLRLRRQQRLLRAVRICLSVGDQISLGEQALSLEQLCRPFGSAAVLKPAPVESANGPDENVSAAAPNGLNRPVRNPSTGMLEEQRS